MKIALCFFGYFGKQNILHKLNQLNGYSLNDYNEMWSIEHFKKNVIQNYDVDIFFHCWNQDSESQNLLINEYQPKDYLFEKQYNHKFHLWRFYSESKCINLMKKYVIKNKIKYDFVFLSIFDQIFFTKINFNELEPNYIYNSFCNNYNKMDNYFYKNKIFLYDQWYLSNLENINLITDYYEIMKIFKKYNLKEYGTHMQRKILIINLGLIDKLKFIKYVGIDHIKCNQIFLDRYKKNLNRLK
jgi:hypothetical protein